jgi:hypothetical protein
MQPERFEGTQAGFELLKKPMACSGMAEAFSVRAKAWSNYSREPINTYGIP